MKLKLFCDLGGRGLFRRGATRGTKIKTWSFKSKGPPPSCMLSILNWLARHVESPAFRLSGIWATAQIVIAFKVGGFFWEAIYNSRTFDNKINRTKGSKFAGNRVPTTNFIR